MGESKTDEVFRSPWYDYGNRMTKNSEDLEKCTSSSSSSSSSHANSNSSFGESMVSNGSLSESDTADDASSPSGSFSFSANNSNGSLYDLSEIMAQLPIKRGLSKFYQGKSESFTSLSRVTSIEDLAKKTPAPYRKQLRASKSCGTGLNRYKPYTLQAP